MSNRVFSIGVDVGGTSIKSGITDENGRIFFKDKRKTDVDRGSGAIVASIVKGVDAVLSQGALRMAEIGSIGLGIPGTTDSKSGVVVFAPNLFWRNVEIVKTIRQFYDIPVYIAQDTRAAAWAEYLIGAGRGLESVASVTLGTGIGCGMVFEGRIYHGALNTAGEFGHQIVELDGNPCNCGRHGCLEAHAGGLAIVREAKAKIPDLCGLLQKDPAEVEVSDVFRLAQDGHAQARQITEQVVKYIGMGLVNLINITSLELISISGGISNAPCELLLGPLVEFVRNRAYKAVSSKAQVCRSSLRDDAPLIGAALLYRENPDR